ncbi:Hypp7753 [Branchiostoma lanceolatum]|uniref:Hypp7753 protein n=1 Tax=Branchiostoma lanceolatum TaxID=7740 RepID=A0A8J9Z3U0_BRALA|nr:Hypp7753 [Branchiostoma lanceolatum]
MRTRRQLYRQKQAKKPSSDKAMAQPQEENEGSYVCSRCRDREDYGSLFRACVGCVSFGMWLLFCYLIFRMVLLVLYPELMEAEDGIGPDPVTCVQLTLPPHTLANIRGRMSQLQLKNL